MVQSSPKHVQSCGRFDGQHIISRTASQHWLHELQNALM